MADPRNLTTPPHREREEIQTVIAGYEVRT